MIKFKLYILLYFGFLSCASPPHKELVIACASNLGKTCAELCEGFSEKSGVACRGILASSGTLSSQILMGARIDVFLAADDSYTNKVLASNQNLLPGQVYASIPLLLYYRNLDSLPLKKLIRSEKNKIALANPEIAPMGRLSKQWLMAVGLWEEVQSKVVNGNSISQVNQYLTSASVNMGISSLSFLYSPEYPSDLKFRKLGDSSHVISNQYVMNVAPIEKRELANSFIEFLMSETSQLILNSNGYSTKASNYQAE